MARQAEIKVEILADPRNFEQGIQRTTRATEGIQQKLGNFAKVAVAALAVTAINAVKKFAEDSIRAFSELEQATGAVDAVFGDQGERIDKWAKAAAQNLGLAESAAKQSSVVIGAMLQNYGFSVEESATQTMKLIEIGADLSAMFGGTTADAVSAIGAALRGETESIEKYGVSMNATKVQAEALAMGLAATTAELTAEDKAMAALKILTDQTSKAQGQFGREAETVAGKQQRLSAELENQKALLGQALIPLHSQWQAIQAQAIPIIAELATQVGLLTGALTEAEAGLLRFQQQEGRTVETAEELISAMGRNTSELTQWFTFFRDSKPDDWVVAMKEAISTTELSSEEFAHLTVILNTMRHAGEITTEQQKELTEAIENNQAAKARDDYRNLMRGLQDATGATTELETATEELNVEVKTGIELAREAHDANRAATDALFGVNEATRNQAEAQAVVNQLAADGKTDTDEYIIALEDLSGANADLKAAQIKLIEQGGLTREEFVNQQISMGMLREDAERLAEVYKDLFTPKSVTHTIRVKDLSTGQYSSDISGKAHGGPVQKGQPYKVGEQGEEVFIPDSYGTIVPNNKISRGGSPLQSGDGSMMPPVVVNFNISPQPFSDPHANAKAIIEYLDRYRRSNGRFPWER